MVNPECAREYCALFQIFFQEFLPSTGAAQKNVEMSRQVIAPAFVSVKSSTLVYKDESCFTVCIPGQVLKDPSTKGKQINLFYPVI